MDSWFSATENFELITGKGRHLIAALKDNRLIAVTGEDRKTKRFLRVEELDILGQTVVRGWLRGYKDEVLVVLPKSLQTKIEARGDCIWHAAT